MPDTEKLIYVHLVVFTFFVFMGFSIFLKPSPKPKGTLFSTPNFLKKLFSYDFYKIRKRLGYLQILTSDPIGDNSDRQRHKMLTSATLSPMMFTHLLDTFPIEFFWLNAC